MTRSGRFAILLTIVLSFSPWILQAQPDPFGNDDKSQNDQQKKRPPIGEQDLKDRLVPGLASNALSLTFGGSQVSISVAPRLGYMLSRRWMAGVGAAYQYFKFESRRGSFQDQYYGGELFTNYRVYNNILVLGEYELMNVKDRQQLSLDDRTWQPGVFLGLGYRQGGGRLIFDAKAKYNLNHQGGVSPYAMALVIGFNVFLR
jgi:hypothetical protein